MLRYFVLITHYLNKNNHTTTDDGDYIIAALI